MKKGKLIVFEGPDTSGKTTLIKNLKLILPTIYNNEVFLFTREPGNLLDGDINESERIRKNILRDSSLSSDEQAILFAESRYYHTVDIVNKLNEGNNVISDRYLFSSIIYQGLDLGFNKVLDYNKRSLKLLKENNIDINNIVLQISLDTYNKRMSIKEKDALEDVDNSIVFERINTHNNINEINNDLCNNLGQIYSIDANRGQSYVIIDAINYIDRIVNM